MYSQALLSRERNFLELNKELEEKVQGLMIEVDSIINKQIDVMKSPKRFPRVNRDKAKETQSSNAADKRNLNDETSIKNGMKNAINKEKSSDANDNDSDENDQGNHVNLKPANKTTEKTINRFLKAQVTKLQSDLQTAQFELKKKVDHSKELESEIKKHEEKKEKFISQISSQKETILKIEEANSDLQAKIQMQVTEMSSLKKEIESLKKELRSANQLVLNSDLRHHRSLEEIEKLRSSLKASQTEEKELREQIRKIHEEKRLALKNSDKQRNEIFQALKKQTQLVDNLKKQKAYLEASQEIKYIEEDFTRLLEWKPDKV